MDIYGHILTMYENLNEQGKNVLYEAISDSPSFFLIFFPDCHERLSSYALKYITISTKIQ